MSIARSKLLLLIIAATVLGAGCANRRHCDTSHPYLEAGNGPELKAPPGLSVPDNELGMVIPERGSAAPPLRPEECIALPPKLDTDTAAAPSEG